MKQKLLELWNLGWWTFPLMLIMASPWLPGLNALWVGCLTNAKEVFQIAAPVITILIVINRGLLKKST